MWEAFKDDIESCDEFCSREHFNGYVKAWVENSIEELGRIERYYLSVDDPTKELDIKIGDETGEE